MASSLPASVVGACGCRFANTKRYWAPSFESRNALSTTRVTQFHPPHTLSYSLRLRRLFSSVGSIYVWLTSVTSTYLGDALFGSLPWLLSIVSIPLGGWLFDRVPLDRRAIRTAGLAGSGVFIAAGASAQNAYVAALCIALATAQVLSVEGQFWATMTTRSRGEERRRRRHQEHGQQHWRHDLSGPGHRYSPHPLDGRARCLCQRRWRLWLRCSGSGCALPLAIQRRELLLAENL